MINAHNQWWGRFVEMYSVDVRIGNETLALPTSPVVLWSSQQRAVVLVLTIPEGTPIGSQQWVVEVWYTQTTLLVAGQEGILLTIPITTTVTS